MKCRMGCGACCIAPSISSLDKPAGTICRHLSASMLCLLFDSPERPACCTGLRPAAEFCGDSREQAMALLTELETATCPGIV